MKDFEKALEEKSKDFMLNYINSKSDTFLALGITSPHAMRKDFESGARWAREFTVREIVKFVKNIEDELGGIVVPRLGQTEAQAYASAIESHFKDRGGE